MGWPAGQGKWRACGACMLSSQLRVALLFGKLLTHVHGPQQRPAHELVPPWRRWKAYWLSNVQRRVAESKVRASAGIRGLG